MKADLVRQDVPAICGVSCPFSQPMVIVNIQIRTRGALYGQANIPNSSTTR